MTEMNLMFQGHDPGIRSSFRNFLTKKKRTCFYVCLTFGTTLNRIFSNLQVTKMKLVGAYCATMKRTVKK